MIQVTRIDGDEFYVNADLILFLEANPDTVLTLTDGKKVRVKETIPDLLDRIVAFRKRSMPQVVSQQEESA